MEARRLVTALVGAVSLAAAVSGCALVPRPVETRLPPGAPAAASPTPSAEIPAPSRTATASPQVTGAAPTTLDGTVSCGDGGSESLSGSEQAFRLVGTCAEVTVSGSALTVDATGATIGTLRLSGDRLRVTTAAVDALTVQGNDDSVTSSAAMTSADVSGDRATIQADGAITTVVVRGQDNVVQSGLGVGSATVEGRGNQIR